MPLSEIFWNIIIVYVPRIIHFILRLTRSGKKAVFRVYMILYLHGHRMRDNYMWKTRADLSHSLHPKILSLIDFIHRHDPKKFKINTVSGGIHIISAHIDNDINVTDILQNCAKPADNSIINMSKVLHLADMDADSSHTYELRIMYSGHANKERRHEAGTYVCVYSVTNKDKIQFPPYNAFDVPKLGFRSRRMVKAVLNETLDVTKEIRMIAGLHSDFYKECENLQIVQTKDIIRSLLVNVFKIKCRSLESSITITMNSGCEFKIAL